MSRAFVKESDRATEVSIDRGRSEHPYYVTLSGLKELQKRPELQRRLEDAVVIDPRTQPRGVVAFGASVSVELPGGDRQTYRIVGEDEADPLHGSISWRSPLAGALLEHRAGERVVWRRPAGDLRVRIVAIDYH
jgi:transcription elongation factor GreB